MTDPRDDMLIHTFLVMTELARFIANAGHGPKCTPRCARLCAAIEGADKVVDRSHAKIREEET
jgi:hypothetical protein